MAYKNWHYWQDNYDECVVTRVVCWPYNQTALTDSAVAWTKRQLGLPYSNNWEWKWYTNTYYCSQLNWAAYYYKTHWYCRVDVSLGDAVPFVRPDDIFTNARVYPIAIGW